MVRKLPSHLKTKFKKCYYCGIELTRLVPWTKDHVWPRGKGGVGNRFNIVLCCESCNSSKGDKFPSVKDTKSLLVEAEKELQSLYKHNRLREEKLLSMIIRMKDFVDSHTKIVPSMKWED